MRTLVAMSGGVDSSVAAALLVEAGHDVVGVTLKQWEDEDGNLPTAGCCTVGDAEDARRVAAQLDIPYYVLDYVDEFRQAVVEPFGRQYLAGRTPNPCVECNRKVRFNALLQRTAELGCTDSRQATTPGWSGTQAATNSGAASITGRTSHTSSTC